MSEKYIQTQTPATLNISPILKEKQSNLSFQKPFALINKHDYNFKQQILESSQIFNSDLQSPKKQKKLKKITIEKKEKDIQNIVDYKDYKPSCMYHPKTTEIDQYKSDYQKSIDNLESLKVHHYHLENYDPTIKNINIYNKNQSQLDSMFGLSLLQRMGSKQELSYGINKLREHFKKDAQKYANYNGKKYYQIMSNQELDTKENRTSLIYQMKNFKSALDMEVGQKKIKIKQFAEHQIEEKQQKIEEKDSETSILSGHTDHIYMEDSSENSISDDSNKDFSQLNDFNQNITCLKFNHYQNTQEKNNIEIQQQQQKNQNSSENNKQLQKLVHQQNLPLDKIIYYLQEDIKLDPKSFNKQFLRQRKSQIIQKTDRSKLQINKNNQNNFENSRSSISSDSVDKKQKQLNQLNSPKNCSILYQSNKNLNFPNLKQNRHSFPLISGISNSQLKSKISKNFQQQNKNDVNIKQQEQKQIKNISKTFLSQRLVKDDNENDENQKQNLNNSKKVNKRNKSTTYRGTTQLYHVIPKNLITAQDVQFFQNLKKKQEEKQNKKLSHLSLDKSLLNNLKLSKSSLSTAVSNIETSNLKNLLQKQSKMLQKYHNNQSQTNCNKNNLINQSQLQSSSPYFSSYSDFASANQCSIIQQNPKNQNLINMLCSPNSNQNNGNSLFSLKYLDFETPTSQKNEQDYMILDKKNTPCCSFCKKPYNQSTKQQKFFITKKNSYKNK